MNILGLNIEEYCSAALMVDGQVVAASAEERFLRRKNWSGFPINAVKYCLEAAGLTLDDIDHVAVEKLPVNNVALIYSYVQRRSSFCVADYVKEEKEYWYPLLYENRVVDYLELFKDKFQPEHFPKEFNDHYLNNREKYFNADMDTVRELKIRFIRAFLPEIPEEKIHFYPHHETHAFYAYYSSKAAENGEKVHVVTADSFGDFENGTISSFEKGHFERLHQVDNHNMGRLFRNITLLLGMKPYEHEYKLMGLAPYAKDYLAEEAYRVFNSTMQVDGLNFTYEQDPPDNYFWFKDRLEGVRFDGIAGGLQKYLEDRMTKWIGNACREYSIRNLLFSGGLAMNIKLNMMLAAMDGYTDFFVPASPDDCSNSIGVCFRAMYGIFGDDAHERITPLGNMFLGPDIKDGEIDEQVKANKLSEFCTIKKNVKSDHVAGRLSKGIVVGRASGRMEFGARALGNRSILADPRDPALVDRINSIIKKRDFWMPFAPVVMDTYWEKYLINPKKVVSPYMTVGFDTTDPGRKAMGAAIHSADKTTRPQMLTREMNPGYYDILKAFEKKTGIGALLNTSFNLHGYPIVLNAQDAVGVFLNSELDALLINDTYIEKKREPHV